MKGIKTNPTTHQQNLPLINESYPSSTQPTLINTTYPSTIQTTSHQHNLPLNNTTYPSSTQPTLHHQITETLASSHLQGSVPISYLSLQSISILEL